MKYFAILIGVCACTLASSAFAWDALVCNYSKKQVVVFFSVSGTEPFTQVVPSESNSSSRSVAGLCINGIQAVADGSTQAMKTKEFLPGMDCANTLVNVFDVPKIDGTAALILRPSSGIGPENCQQN